MWRILIQENYFKMSENQSHCSVKLFSPVCFLARGSNVPAENRTNRNLGCHFYQFRVIECSKPARSRSVVYTPPPGYDLVVMVLQSLITEEFSWKTTNEKLYQWGCLLFLEKMWKNVKNYSFI